jgi:NTE family protein
MNAELIHRVTAGGEAGAPDALDVLREAPMLAHAPADALAELAAECVPRWLEDGVYLFHAGAPADNLYVIAAGALEVVRLSPRRDQEVVLNVLEPGRTVGELAFLRSEPRSASVRAKGRTLVYSVDGQFFLAFVRKWPEIAITIARGVAESFVRVENDAHVGRRQLWALVTAPSLGEDFALELVRAAIRYLPGASAGGRVVVLSDRAPAILQEGGARVELRPLDERPAELARAVEGTRRDAALVVVVGPLAAVEGVVRRATGVVTVGGALPPLADGARHVELIDSGPVSATRVRRSGDPAALAARVARLLLGCSVGLALGGGAAKALAHLGVLQVLEDAGVAIDFVCGTSMGAVVGAFYVANGLASTVRIARDMRTLDWLLLLGPSSFVSGMVKAKRFMHHLERNLNVRAVEDMPIPYASVSLDLDTGAEYIAREGSVVDAMLGSISIPGIFAPYEYRPPHGTNVMHLVDGGAINNVPVDAVRAMGADRVVGCHVTERREPANGHKPSWLMRAANLVPTLARAQILVKAHLLGHERAGERQVLSADLPIVTDTTAYGYSDFRRVAELIEVGRRSASAVADELRVLA